MKIRVKFRKYDAMKFVGHLDLMRFFQKLIMRSGIPSAFTEGFQPHMIMSFASPLSVGQTSDGEYFDLGLTLDIDCGDAVRKMNENSVPGIDIVAAVPIADERKRSGMAILAAADYICRIDGGFWPYEVSDKDKPEIIAAFLKEDHIPLIRKKGDNEREDDIRGLIYDVKERNDGLFMRLAAGSTGNLKPDDAMRAFADFAGADFNVSRVSYHRTEMYARVAAKLNAPQGETGALSDTDGGGFISLLEASRILNDK